MSRRDGLRRGASASTSAFAFLGVALMPKCPVCVAAVLSTVGVGATFGAWFAPVARPFGLAVAVLALVVFARSEWRRRRRRVATRECGCAPGDGAT